VTVAVVAAAMFLCNFHRSILSVVALPVAEELHLDMAGLGVLSSAFLWGYGAFQIPAGYLADRFGGIPVLIPALLLWSAATMLAPLALHTPNPLVAFLALRVIMGVASAAALPSTAATLTKLVPPEHRARTTSMVYSAFNMGTVMGLYLTPMMVHIGGWPLAFTSFGALGMVLAVVAKAVVSWMRRRRVTKVEVCDAESNECSQRETYVEYVPQDITEAPSALLPPGPMAVQVAALMWVHSCIGFGFFVLQGWLPTFFIKELGVSTDMVGVLSAVPWIATAVVGYNAGRFADWLLTVKGWASPRVRTLMMMIATAGPAVSLLLLTATKSPPLAIFCLTLVLGTQSFNYAGFHTYVQEVAGSRSGTLLGLSNMCGIFLGIIGNLFAGWLVQTTGSFSWLFLVTATIYCSSGLTWLWLLKGARLWPQYEAPQLKQQTA